MKILSVFGTRPEAIKMMPVVKALKKRFGEDDIKTCVTAQHRDLLDTVLHLFSIKPDFDLNIMQSHQTLSDITCAILKKMQGVFVSFKPDWLLVQGDTTTTMTAALAAFYDKIPVAHIEAGLRSNNRFAPWPEEINRQLTTVLADLHFAPTQLAAENLIRVGIPPDKILVTGNTVIDALLEATQIIKYNPTIAKKVSEILRYLHPEKKLLLVTMHRRENFGLGVENICRALLKLADLSNVQIIYPVHPNPSVLIPVRNYLQEHPNIHLIEPLDYISFIALLERSYLVLTDSGGIQEEAPSLGKPVLVLRDVTERQEGIDAGTIKLIGTNEKNIVSAVKQLLTDDTAYVLMSKKRNPYGDGQAANRIVTKFEMLDLDAHPLKMLA